MSAAGENFENQKPGNVLEAQLEALQNLIMRAAVENFENQKPEMVLEAQLDVLQKFIMSAAVQNELKFLRYFGKKEVI